MQNNKKIPKLRFREFTKEWEEKRADYLLERYSNPVDINVLENYRQIGTRSHGKGIFHKESVTGKELGNKRVFWVHEKALVINIVFAWEHSLALTSEKEKGFIASHRFPMYLPKENRCNLNFILEFFLRKYGKYLLELASPGGAGRNKTLGQSNFNELKLIVPSLEEQERIVEFLGLVDQKIEKVKEQLSLLKQYKKGMIEKIFSQKIRFKKEDGSNFKDWTENTLRDIGSTYGGLTGKDKNDFNINGGKPYIQYKQVFSKSNIDISNTGLVCISVEETKKKRQKKVNYGDILFTTSSEIAKEVGMSSVLLTSIKRLYLNSFCFGYRPNSIDILYPSFSKYLFREASFRKNMRKLAQGSTRYNISKKEVMKIIVNLPEKEEQIKIANFLTKIDERIEASIKQLEESKEYKKSLLQQMFI